ncbi:hypothetical protein KTN05_16945 [Paracoccus sp. Z118]|uniref:hypothetical protein n=1 Tax=Paracoccus sp. Z118 TaxID=2851017 RepID=UPI001C2C6FE9|nr:hypothetical protein [Paracoccus sp. Z118]MBV0893484.1 hypothetical protein [Paracoccus sp. Z118]
MAAGNLEAFRPEGVIVDAGDTQNQRLGAIIMGMEDVRRVFDATDARIVASTWKRQPLPAEPAQSCRTSRLAVA